MNDQRNVHVVLGTGPLGLGVARHLAVSGARVRAVNASGRADLPDGVEVVAANLTEPGEARRACDGAMVVYHCASPPYAKWPELHPPLMDAILDGAAAAEARLVFGDNLYAYGPVDGPLTEDLPYRATGPNGRTRARIAETLMQAHEAGRVQASIGRGSDFFGPHAHLSTVGDRVFRRAIEGKPAQVLGNPDVPHTVTSLEDFARALVTLGEREEALGQVWHVPNPETVTIRRFVQIDTPMSDEDFVVLENDLRKSTDDDVVGFRTFAETIFLEGTFSGDRCQGCVHQELNGSRAMELAEAELSKRQ